ncbi:MAG: tetratricopeptide repeat protein [Deltaproteobacteria bacterium]|nr:tetratricopeptide repeat protein [Deltaproteobacteria bacterium]
MKSRIIKHSWLILLIFLLSGCSIPKIIFIDDPLSPREHLELGVAYEQKGEYDLAIREYRSAASQLPVAYQLIGNVYFQKKDYPAAEKEYREAISQMPDNPEPLNNLAWLYYSQRIKLDQAEDLARRALEIAPNERKAVFQDTLDQIRKARAE